MPLMLLSNPGLHLALLGNPRRGRRLRVKGPRSLKRRTFLAGWRRAKKRVGRVFRTRGSGRYKILSARINRDRRHRKHAKGISWSGRRGSFRFGARVRRAGSRKARRTSLTNPRSRKGHTMSRRRRHCRRNPNLVGGYITAAKGAPKQVMSLFTGPNKIKNIGFAAGGAAATYLAGGLVTSKLLTPLLAKIPGASSIVGSPMGKRIVGGLVPFTLGYVASKFVKGDIGKALLVGGAAASILELVKPGMVGQLLAKIPGAPSIAAAAPAVVVPAITGPTKGLDGLGTYVQASGYNGVGDDDDLADYVTAPSYAGVGDEIDGYVQAKGYSAVGSYDEGDDEMAGDEDVMAGVDGYLDQAQANSQSYLAA
jgi:hypothetical protein